MLADERTSGIDLLKKTRRKGEKKKHVSAAPKKRSPTSRRKRNLTDLRSWAIGEGKKEEKRKVGIWGWGPGRKKHLTPICCKKRFSCSTRGEKELRGRKKKKGHIVLRIGEDYFLSKDSHLGTSVGKEGGKLPNAREGKRPLVEKERVTS